MNTQISTTNNQLLIQYQESDDLPTKLFTGNQIVQAIYNLRVENPLEAESILRKLLPLVVRTDSALGIEIEAHLRHLSSIQVVQIKYYLADLIYQQNSYEYTPEIIDLLQDAYTRIEPHDDEGFFSLVVSFMSNYLSRKSDDTETKNSAVNLAIQAYESSGNIDGFDQPHTLQYLQRAARMAGDVDRALGCSLYEKYLEDCAKVFSEDNENYYYNLYLYGLDRYTKYLSSEERDFDDISKTLWAMTNYVRIRTNYYLDDKTELDEEFVAFELIGDIFSRLDSVGHDREETTPRATRAYSEAIQKGVELFYDLTHPDFDGLYKKYLTFLKKTGQSEKFNLTENTIEIMKMARAKG